MTIVETMQPEQIPSVTLILAVRNEEAHIEACLRSILGQDYPRERLSCILVDGASDDRTVEVARRLNAEDGRLRIYDNPHRTMPHGLNVGIRESVSDYVGLVSGHSTLPGDYVRRAVAALQHSGAWSVGGRIVRTTNGPVHRAIAIATGSRFGVGDGRHNYAEKPGWVETAFPGFWRRDTFTRVGLFDPDMLVNEDNELSHRIRMAGGRIWYDPEIAVEYVPRPTFGALFRQYSGYARGKIRVYRKHGGGLRWRHLVPGAWLAFGVLGGAVGAFFPTVGLIWLGAIAAYVMTVTAAAFSLREPGVAWWRIAAALTTLHVAYGVGSWTGILDLVRRQ